MYATNANGITPVLTTANNDGMGMNGAGWLLPFLLFGRGGLGGGWGGGYGYDGGVPGGRGCGCGPTLASELGKAENAAVLNAINGLASTISSDKSAAQTASVVAAVGVVENQITNLLNAGQLADCARQAELIRTIDQCCCRVTEGLCEVKTTVMMGNQALESAASIRAMQHQHEIDSGFCAVNTNIANVRTDLSNQLCQVLNTLTNTVRDDGDKTRSMLHAAEVTELRDKLAQCSNNAQTAELKALIASSCGHHGGHHGCCTTSSSPGNSGN